MPIIRTKHTTDFTITPNAVCNDAPLSLEAIGLWAFLISKPPSWDFDAKAIKKRFKVGLNKIYRIMRELSAAGYARYQRIQSDVIWFIYDTPQTIKTATAPAVIHRVNFECSQNECVLERNETEIKKETTTQPAETVMQTGAITPVVVSSCEVLESVVVAPEVIIKTGPVAPEEKQSETIMPPDSVAACEEEKRVVADFVYHEDIIDGDLIACKEIAKLVKKPELTPEILLQLKDDIDARIIKGTIPRYFRGLVNAANRNGTFTRNKADTDSKHGRNGKGGQSHKPPENVDYTANFYALLNELGDKGAAAAETAAAVIPGRINFQGRPQARL